MNSKSTLLLTRMTLALLVILMTGISFAQTYVTIGTGTSTNSVTSYPAPYGNYWYGARHQFLIRGSEIATGFTGAGLISSLAFDVATMEGTPLQGFTISLGTTQDSVISNWHPGTTPVYYSPAYTDTLGWNTHVFQGSYFWDGSSNIVVEVCFNNTSYTDNALTRYTTTSFNSAIYYRDDAAGICGNPGISGTSANRPNMKLGIDTLSAHDLAVVGWTAPTSVCGLTSQEQVTIQIANYGTSTETVFLAGFSIDSGATLHLDTILTLLLPLDTMTYTFNDMANFAMPSHTFYCGAAVVLPTDQNPGNDQFEVTFTTPYGLPYSNTFDNGPGNWDGAMNHTNFPHAGGSGGVMYSNLYSFNPYTYLALLDKYGPLDAQSYVSFDYGIVNYSGGTATTLVGDSLILNISNDCGMSYMPLHVIDSANHTPSTGMQQVMVSLAAFNGDDVTFAFEGIWGAGDYYFDLDNFAIVNPPSVSLGPDTMICMGETLLFDAGNDTNYTYSWTWLNLGNGDTVGTMQTLSIGYSGTYAVIVDNGFGLTDSDTINIMVYPAPSIVSQMDQTICSGDMAMLDVTFMATDLFFSEYIEGSSNNKAMEIFNGTADTVSLDNYRINQSVNGNGWAYQHYFPIGAMLAPGETWTIITDQTDTTMFHPSGANEVLGYPSVVHHNGDDARGLEVTYDAGQTWNLIDLIGDPNNDPGSGWNVAGVGNATANHTMVRKAYVHSGNTDWVGAAGIDSISSEWIVYPQNTFTMLGSHSTSTMGDPSTVYMWSNGSSTASINVMPTSTTTYTVTVTNGYNCWVTDDITVNVNPAPSYAITGDFNICEGDSSNLLITPMILASDLFFSEYIEGSSNNKALEVYNGTGAPVSLDNYRINQSVNGGGWAYQHSFPTGATLAHGETWTIITNQTDTALFNYANANEVLSYPSVVHHNGDDARGLEYTADGGTTWTLVDLIGDPNNDPGSGWDVAGVANGTQNYTLVRKPDVHGGNLDWAVAAGIDSASSEWIVYPQNTFGYLGSHTMNTAGGPALTYSWSTGDTTANVTVNPMTTTIYTVTVSTANACVSMDSITVTVSPNPMPMITGTDTICINNTATLDAGAGYATYLWSDNSTGQTLQVDGSVVGVGTHTYSVTVTSNDGCDGSTTFDLYVDACTGIEDPEAELSMSLFPNPSDGIVSLSVKGLNEDFSLRIMNAQGQEIFNEQIGNSSFQYIRVLDMTKYPSGIYFFEVSTADKRKVERVVLR